MAINGSGRFIGPGHPIRDGLIGWYDNRYKEPDLSSGGDWIDLSGENNTMAANSSPSWVYGWYFDLDGSEGNGIWDQNERTENNGILD